MPLSTELQKKIEDYKSKDIHQVKIAVTDVDGVMRGKYLSLSKFSSLVESTGGFCDCIFGWDVADILYDNSKFTGWHTAYPDALFKIDIHSERMIPDEGIPFFIADFVGADGQSTHPICPRNVLKRVLTKASDMGYSFNLAFEYEFFLFNETPQSIRDKNYKNLTPLTPGMFGYSVIRNSTHSELFQDLMTYCELMNIKLEGLHCETGPGVWEAAIQYDEALSACDKAELFKTFSKVFFQKRELLATFMARWDLKYPGQSGHLHQSIQDLSTNKNIFFDDSQPYKMSQLMRQYVAGQIKYLKSFLLMTSPTVNSYARLVKGFWAPTASTWGVENRTTALRVIPGSESSQRVEFRVGSADANPYLTAAAMIGAGLLGIEEGLELENPLTGNAYEVQDDLSADRQFPTNLSQSIENFRVADKTKSLFGEEFSEHYLITREWEWREYEKSITDWQLERYFEII